MSDPTNYSPVLKVLRVVSFVLTLILFLGSMLLLLATLDSYQQSGGFAIATYVFYLAAVGLTILVGSLTAFAGRAFVLAQITQMILLTLAAALGAGTAAESSPGDSYGTMFLLFAGPAFLGLLIGLVIFLFKYARRTTI